uniref:PLD phosphodiesterase domain-containing protein n=1 Tax=Globisporangium ultimum (strain ATCC 200006 / CBS 805.95 / DAOM BR144) TaxID=431595 RepID=K3X0S7_GLOUD
MHEFGADRGLLLLKALHDAAARGVTLRILTAKESIGGDNSTGNSSLPEEVKGLVDAFPKQVEVHCWSATGWYGGGILHQKIWIFDKQHVYVGSANMDWKSLAQVMEVGVMMDHLPSSSLLLEDIQRLFDVWWLWASPELPVDTSTYFSDRFQSQLMVPSWSQFLPKHKRIPDPFVRARLEAHGNIEEQIKAHFGASPQQTHAHMFVAAAPLEATAAHSRAFDEDALVYTIRNATSRVSLSVMDFVPYSMYTLSTHAGSISWPALTDALLAGIYAKRGLHVRLLISQWQHSNRQMFPALALLQQQAALCAQFRDPCTGKLEIKVFHVPGWDNTTATALKEAKWPAYTRVNHAKYIVTDTRANIGTSNMEWGYFYTTAGASVNTDHEPTREALETLFNRNWDSSYAQPLNTTSVDASL